MSIISECEKVGIALQKCELGKQILDNFKIIQGTLSPFAFDLFIQISNTTKWGIHFFSYQVAYDMLKYNSNPLFAVDVKQIHDNSNIMNHLILCKQMGEFIEKTCVMLFQNNVKNSFQSSLKLTPKVIRAIQDLSVACQRTGLLQSLLKNRKSQVFLEYASEFDKLCGNDRSYPYSKKVRLAIKKMVQSRYNKREIDIIYWAVAVVEIIKQIIFEAFMGYILTIDTNSIIKNNTKTVGKIRIFKFELNKNSIQIMNKNVDIIKLSSGQSNEYGLVLQKRFKQGQNETFDLSIKGLLYPNDDRIEILTPG